MNEINLSLFGGRLKEARKKLGLKQADAADLAGVTREHWGRCERGLGMPGGEVLVALATAGANVRYILIGGEDGPDSEQLTEDEKGMLADYREASGPVRRAARAALKSATSQSEASVNQSVNAKVGGNVTGSSINLGGKTIKNNR